MAEKLSTMSACAWPSSTFRYPTSQAPCQALAMECANEVPCDRIRVEVQEASADSVQAASRPFSDPVYLESACCVKT